LTFTLFNAIDEKVVQL